MMRRSSRAKAACGLEASTASIMTAANTRSLRLGIVGSSMKARVFCHEQFIPTGARMQAGSEITVPPYRDRVDVKRMQQRAPAVRPVWRPNRLRSLADHSIRAAEGLRPQQ